MDRYCTVSTDRRQFSVQGVIGGVNSLDRTLVFPHICDSERVSALDTRLWKTVALWCRQRTALANERQNDKPTDTVMLTNLEVGQFRAFGFVVLRDCLTPQEVAEIGRAYKHVMARAPKYD